MSPSPLLIVTIIASIVIVNGQNCSTHNTCGKNGYCRNSPDGHQTCECKFWWNGTRCDQQTNSGTQVIVLGCLLAFLIALVYGLRIARYVHNRRKQPKQEKEKEIVNDPKIITIALQSARRSARLSSCLTACLVIIVTTIALVAKWLILQPIHNEIIYKFLNNQSIYYTQNPFCKKITYERFNVITFPVACLLILIFIIRTKRISLWPDKCHGYGAPPIPVDFISHIDRKFAAVVFAICADELIAIMQEVLSGNKKKGEGVIVVYLLRLLQVLIMGVRYFPFLAAIYINSILTLTCATIYAWLDYSVTVVNLGMCQADFYPTYDDYQADKSSLTIEIMLDFYGTGPNLVVVLLCTEIPRFLCLAYISVKIPILLINKIRRRFKKNIPLEQRILMKLTREQRLIFGVSRPISVEMQYVRNLFRSPNNRPRSQALFARLIPKKIYEWRDDFRFSTRVLCVYSAIFLFLYFAAIQACIRVLPYLDIARIFLQGFLDVIISEFFPISVKNNNGNDEVDENQVINGDTSNFPVPHLVRPYLIALLLTIIIIIIQLLVLLVSIRRNLIQVFRGDDSEIPRRHRSKYVSLSSGNIHFAGYFIGYLILGFLIIAIAASVICVSFEAFTIFGSVRIIEKLLVKIIPTILFLFFKKYLNIFLAQHVFLQHRGEVLAINNRRILMIFMYFNIFLDAFLGLISSIFRLIKSFIAGIFYMCRLDYSPFGRKLETMDGGFSSYCGFIHTECAHRHPVMLVFVSHLYTQLKIKQMAKTGIDFRDSAIEEKYRIQIRTSSRYSRKWKLAAFLIRNPTIVFYRKAFLNQLHIEEVHALNDLDSDEKENMRRRLSVYARRLSATQLGLRSDSITGYYQANRF